MPSGFGVEDISDSKDVEDMSSKLIKNSNFKLDNHFYSKWFVFF
jgi:hypothetical protein